MVLAIFMLLVVFAMALAASCVVDGINGAFYGCFSSFGVIDGGFVSFVDYLRLLLISDVYK